MKTKFNKILLDGCMSNRFATKDEILLVIDTNHFIEWFQKKIDNILLSEPYTMPCIMFAWLKEAKTSKQEGILIGQLIDILNKKRKEIKIFQYLESFISDEKDLIEKIIEQDYFSNWYTENNDISFNTINALLKYRNKAIRENPDKHFNTIEKIELRWDNWNDIPREANKTLMQKKQIENEIIIIERGRSVCSLYLLKIQGLHGIIKLK